GAATPGREEGRLEMKRLPLIALLVAGVAYGQPGNQPPQPAPSPTPVNEPPPTGPGLGQPTPPPNRGALELTPEELEELKQVEADYEQFLEAARNHDTRMRMIARHEYTERTKEL